jgi:hypothetical protein
MSSSKKTAAEGHVGNLDEHQQKVFWRNNDLTKLECLDNLKSQLRGNGVFLSKIWKDSCLLRFLRARAWNVEQATTQVELTIVRKRACVLADDFRIGGKNSKMIKLL